MGLSFQNVDSPQTYSPLFQNVAFIHFPNPETPIGTGCGPQKTQAANLTNGVFSAVSTQPQPPGLLQEKASWGMVGGCGAQMGRQSQGATEEGGQ